MQDGEVRRGVEDVGRGAGDVRLLQHAVTMARKSGATSAELLEVAGREGFDCAQFADPLAEDEGAALLADARRYSSAAPPGGTGVNRLHVDGWGVAQVEFERSWSGPELADKCWLFRSPPAWTLVTMRRDIRYGDGGEPLAGGATVTTTGGSDEPS